MYIKQPGAQLGRYPELRVTLEFGRNTKVRGRTPARMKITGFDRGPSYPNMLLKVDFVDIQEAMVYIQRFVEGQSLPYPPGERFSVLADPRNEE